MVKKLLIISLTILILISIYLFSHNLHLKKQLEIQNQELSNPSDSIKTEDLPESFLIDNQIKNIFNNYEKKGKLIPNFVPIQDEYAISQEFTKAHPALDFTAPLGTMIYAAAQGEVMQIYEDDYFGKVILINHFNGYASLYAHCVKILVSKYQLVKKGEVIGLVGNTGNSTSPHLHFQIIYKDKYVNPRNILAENL